MRSNGLGDSFRHAFAGLLYAFRTQRNFRIHSAAMLVVLALGLALKLTLLEFAVITMAIAAVFVAELANTAVEAAVDLAAPYVDPLARVAKDVAAAGVLLAALAAVVVGGLVLGPHILSLLR